MTQRGRGTVKVFAYSHQPGLLDHAAEPAGKLAAAHDVAVARVVHPLGPEAAPRGGGRFQLWDFTAHLCPDPGSPVHSCTDWPSSAHRHRPAAAAPS
ncbi:hypothetical protein ACQB60_22150 [Actinomycetota bacterium Odt1-20B]